MRLIYLTIFAFFFFASPRINAQKLAAEIEKQTGEPAAQVVNYLNESKKIYRNIGSIFLHNSLHKKRTWLNTSVIKALAATRLRYFFSTLNDVNKKAFADKHIAQLFNRYATYSGSNPYKAPAMLKLVPHLEINEGVFYPEGGMIAIRNALYRSASKKANPIGSFKNCFGNGIIKAMDALSIPVQISNQKTPEDTVPWFPVLTTIFKAMPVKTPNIKITMFNTELAQLVFYYPDLASIIENEEKSFDRVNKKQWKKFTDAVIEHPATSVALKRFLMSTHS